MAGEAKRVSVFYGWWVVIACFFIYGLGTMVTSVLTVYAPFMLKELGWTRAEIGTMITAKIWSILVLGVLVGWLIDRYGPKRMITIGAAIGILAVFLVSRMTSMLEAFLYFPGILGVAIVMQQGLPTLTLARRWFNKKSGLATAVVMSSFGVLGAVLYPFLTHLAGSYGWRPVFLWSGVVMEVIILLLGIFIIKDSPEKMGLHMDGLSHGQARSVHMGKSLADEPHMTRGEALRTPQFWIICLGVGITAIFFLGFTTHLTLIGKSVGMTPMQASLVMTVWLLPTTVGKFGGGFIVDKVGKRKTITIFAGLSALAYFYGWFFASNPVSLYFFVILAGIAMSPVIVALPPYFGDMFGRRHLASIYSMKLFVTGLISGGGPFIAGKIAHTTNSYQLVYLLGGLTNVVFVGLMLLVKPTRLEYGIADSKTAQPEAKSPAGSSIPLVRG